MAKWPRLCLSIAHRLWQAHSAAQRRPLDKALRHAPGRSILKATDLALSLPLSASPGQSNATFTFIRLYMFIRDYTRIELFLGLSRYEGIGHRLWPAVGEGLCDREGDR